MATDCILSLRGNIGALSVCLDKIEMYDDWTACVVNDWHRKTPDTGACYNLNGTIKAIWNQTLAKKNDIQRTLPSEEYYE